MFKTSDRESLFFSHSRTSSPKFSGSMISGLPNFTPFAFATAMPCACLFLSSVFAIVPVSQDSSCLDGQYLGYRASRNEIVCCFTTKKGTSFRICLKFNVREKIRTPDLLVRSQTLYPAELRAHYCVPFLLCPSQQNLL